MNKILKCMAVSALVALMVFSIGKLLAYYMESAENQQNIKELTAYTDTKAEKYKELKKRNPDIIGWIKIPGTMIDYPVMWTPANPEKYIRTDFDGNCAACGLPFAAADCKISSSPNEPECSNTLIYGHHMQDKTMFAELVEYEKKKFADKRRIIYYDRIYDDGSYAEFEYEVIGAFKTEVNSGNGHEFRYYEYTDLSDVNAYREYLTKLKERDLLVLKNTDNRQHNLLTLSTCSYHVTGKNGRFVVVAIEE